MYDFVFDTLLTFIEYRFFYYPLAYSLWIYKELLFYFLFLFKKVFFDVSSWNHNFVYASKWTHQFLFLFWVSKVRNLGAAIARWQ